MAETSIEVKVNAKLEVSNETAEACLRIAQIYCNQNGLTVRGVKQEDGTIRLIFIDDKSEIGNERT